jgi:hypothetical protein
MTWIGASGPQIHPPSLTGLAVYRPSGLTRRVWRMLRKTLRILLAMVAAVGPVPPPPPPPSPQTDEESTTEGSGIEAE